MSVEKFLHKHVKAGDRIIDGDETFFVFFGADRQVLWLVWQTDLGMHEEVAVKGFKTFKAPEVWRRGNVVGTLINGERGEVITEEWRRIAVYEGEKKEVDPATNLVDRINVAMGEYFLKTGKAKL